MSASMNYWQEACSNALEEANIEFNQSQLNDIAEAIMHSHECYGMAFGYDQIDRPSKSQAEIELEKIKREIQERERFVASTAPCKSCYTTGVVRDGWGRDVTCQSCSGKGRR